MHRSQHCRILPSRDETKLGQIENNNNCKPHTTSAGRYGHRASAGLEASKITMAWEPIPTI